MAGFFAYCGDHEETRVYGLTFPRGVPVEVTDWLAFKKLSNNCDFSQCFDGVEVLPAEQPTVSQAEPRQKRKYTRRTE